MSEMVEIKNDRPIEDSPIKNLNNHNTSMEHPLNTHNEKEVTDNQTI